MKAARAPRADKSAVRLLVVKDGVIEDGSIDRLADHLEAGDLLVVNDAATLPASLFGRHSGEEVEIRLTTQLGERVWRAALLGPGDWRTPTEDRPKPPAIEAGDEILIGEDLRAKIRCLHPISNRLLDLEFNLEGEELWSSLYRHGRPVQYSYMNDELRLWSVQNIYAGRPWAVEMPSAGHALDWRLLLELIRKGIRIVTLTHGAGLSSTGDGRIDRELPIEERFEIPETTMAAVGRTIANGRRVIAVGTSVVRALESAARGLSGFTNLKLGPGYETRFVGGLLTGTHDVSESHYRLLEAFLDSGTLERVAGRFEKEGYLTHEFGDLCLILLTSVRQGAGHGDQCLSSAIPRHRAR
ncbi:MAG: S-adenosylmethionine:tRNA ribosyltransferase-isomerase [Acidobacteriota bacterium]|nr:MAG: S-adenosylmethionine:tRNA ribosyltransferase-isomerase [Acidobacteriota bacterium]